MAVKHIYDNAYKYIFSNKRIFFQLIKSFVIEDFVKDISFDNIDLVDRSFVSEEFLSRESDIIYKIGLGKEDIYIYILLEFQSTVDKSIPVNIKDLIDKRISQQYIPDFSYYTIIGAS